MHSDRFSLRPEALAAPSSGIVEVFDYGRNRPGLMPLWVGEGDRPTPRFIIEAAEKSLADGETFYTHQAGIPPLREAIAPISPAVPVTRLGQSASSSRAAACMRCRSQCGWSRASATR